MNKRQKAKRNAYGKLQTVLTENATLMKGYVALEKKVLTFNQLLADIDKTNVISASGQGRSNQMKTQAFNALVQELVALCKKAVSWAMDINNPELVDFYGVVKTDFDSISSSNIIALATKLVNGLNRDLANLTDYLVTAKHVKEVEDLIKVYENENMSPMVKVKKTAEANKKLLVLFTEADNQVKSIVNLIEGEYYKRESDFVKLVQSAKAIDDIGSRGTKLTLLVVNKEGKPVADAFGDILEMTDEEQYSNDQGELVFEDMKAGEYHYEVSLGTQKHSGKITLKAGDQPKLKVVL